MSYVVERCTSFVINTIIGLLCYHRGINIINTFWSAFNSINMETKFYKYCAVPKCKSTSIKTPEKLFIHVPKIKKIRDKWISLARRDPKALSVMSTSYFCEDHFDLPNDMINYVEYTTMGKVSKIRMRTGCLPTKFACQPNLSSGASKLRRSIAARRLREAIKKEQEELDQIGTSAINEEYEEVDQIITSALKEEYEELDQIMTSGSQQSEHPFINLPGTSSDCIASLEQQETTKISKAVQTSDVIIISSKCQSEATDTSLATSSFNISKLQIPSSMHMNVTCYNNMGNGNRSDCAVCLCRNSIAHSVLSKASSGTSSFYESELNIEESLQLMLKATILKVEKYPQSYIGVPISCYYLIRIIHEQTSIPKHKILLCLKKIRLNSKFLELGDDFGISVSEACQIFKENVPKIAKVLRPFIVNIDKAANKRCLPIAFRKNYHNVTCIIHCLEIEIQKPNRGIHQAMTWSDYKKANTFKYLISITPNGLVNYVSKGYSGRITDVCLVENCDFLNSLPSGSYVMAIRGFRHIEPLFLSVGCQLIRPASVEAGKQISADIEQIGSLQIHIEQAINRLTEYSMLEPHACINSYLLSKLDDVVVIACGLVNLQNSLIDK